MDWKFVEDEVLELLEAQGIYEANVEDLENIVSRFIKRLRVKLVVDDVVENDVDNIVATNSVWE